MMELAGWVWMVEIEWMEGIDDGIIGVEDDGEWRRKIAALKWMRELIRRRVKMIILTGRMERKM